MGIRNKGFLQKGGVNALRVESMMAKEETRQLRNELRGKRKNRKNWFLNNIEFECQLFRGGDKFPRLKTMTPVSMGRENRLFIINFGSALDKGKDVKLWVWKIKDASRFKKMLDAHVTA